MDHSCYELLAKVAKQNNLDVNKDGDIKEISKLLVTDVGPLRDPMFVYGKRTENAFFDMVRALEGVKFIKKEDTEKFYSTLDLNLCVF